MGCYRRFTALGKTYRQKLLPKVTSVSETKSLRSSSVTTTPCDNVFLFPKVCLFCNKTSLTVKKVKQKLTKVEIKIYDGTFPFQNN